MFLECDGEHYKVVYQDSKFFWVVSLLVWPTKTDKSPRS